MSTVNDPELAVYPVTDRCRYTVFENWKYPTAPQRHHFGTPSEPRCTVWEPRALSLPLSKYWPCDSYTWFQWMLITTREVSTITIPFYRWGNWYSTRLKHLSRIKLGLTLRPKRNQSPGSPPPHPQHSPRTWLQVQLCCSLAVCLSARFSASLVLESTSAVGASQEAILQMDGLYDRGWRISGEG